MAVFEYKAIDLDATDLSGTLIADSPRQARDVLRDRGLTVTNVRPVRQSSTIGFWQRRRGRHAQGEVIAFIREMATLTRAGIPLLSALKTLADQHRKSFKTVVQDLADQVAAGAGLAEAMGRHSAHFDELCVAIVRVGEETGGMDGALLRLAGFKEKAHRLRSNIATALIYPAVVGTFGLAVSVFLMTYVVPNLLGTLAQTGKDLPAVTRFVKAISDFLLGWWWVLLASAVGVMLAVKALLRSESVRSVVDRIVLGIPVIGELSRKENTSRMAVVMATLLGSGLQFVEAIRITRRVIHNRLFRQAMDDYAAAITAGADVAGPLRTSGVFSPMVVQMLAVGQESGQLEEMLEQLSDAYDREVATAAQRLTAVLEPVLIVFLAVLVGFIAFAIMLPILEISNVL